MTDNWKDEMETQREEKNRFLAEHPRSPIPAGERQEFESLDYYPPKEDYRFRLELDEHDEKETITIGTSTGGDREYIVWGEFSLEVNGHEITLNAYRAEEDEDRLWVPFKDATNGDTTYGAGRYLDLEEKEDGKWLLDFNQAYNPYCAYSDQYECPLIPPENHLDVRIEAGEKAYHSEHSYSAEQ